MLLSSCSLMPILVPAIRVRMPRSESAPPMRIHWISSSDLIRRSSALAGFAPEDITVTSEASQLTVSGKRRESQETEYLYQGISARAFERRFNLADYIEVENASFENGLLHINLVRRVPDKLKPRRIEIGNVTKLETKGTGKAA